MELKKPGPTFACTAWKEPRDDGRRAARRKGWWWRRRQPWRGDLGWADVGGPVLDRKGPELRPDRTERQRGRLADGLNTRKRAQTLAKCFG